MRPTNRGILFLALLVLGTLLPITPTRAAGGRATLTLQLLGLRSSSGVVLVTLYASADGFPTKPDKAVKRGRSPIKNGQAVITIRDIAPGTYAVSAIHDENGNGKLETNWLGIPKEGTAASNNAKGKLGPPSFKAASFRIQGDTRQTIRMSYY
jgi:uncharacterized protein (DUF2141 family)